MRLLVAALFFAFAGSSVTMAGDLAAGKKAFNKCKSCHTVGPDAKNKVGPLLNGVVGRQWGAVEGYKYSKGKDGTLMAMAEAEERIWDVASLTEFLRKPKDLVKKTKMSFPGLKKDEDIENVIFYLAQFDAEGNEVDPEEVLSALE